jgi:hypothetical protein
LDSDLPPTQPKSSPCISSHLISFLSRVRDDHLHMRAW